MPASASLEQLVDHFDWGATTLGPRDAWSPVLRFAVALCLGSRMPFALWWGPDAIQIYNDAYATILGKRHPRGLGQPAGECWPEAWDAISPLLAEVRATGQPFWAEDSPWFVERNGFVEEVYFTFSYSLITSDERGEDAGILVACTETTSAVLREREFRAMADTIANVIYTHAADGSVEWANTRWHDYTRLPPEIALTPIGWARVSHRGDRDLLRTTVRRALSMGEPYEVELRLKPDGADDAEYRWFLLRAVPMRAPSGTILRWAGSATDVHDRRLAEDAMRAQLEREHQASRAFQAAALPQILPDVAGLTFSAVYEAAEAGALVGGDWYDAFRLPDGRVVLSVGDVIGSGLGAAVTMAGVRQAIRGAAEMFPEPVDVLDAADRALRSEQPDRIVTAFVGVLDPLTSTFAYSSAGHPAPLVRYVDGTIVELGDADVPLGLRGEKRTERQTSAGTSLPDGALLVLYTDGLTESTRDVLDGERRLHAALRSPAVFNSANPAAAIRAVMLSTPTDDVAVLCVRIDTLTASLLHPRWKFSAADGDTALRIRRRIGAVLQALGATEDQAADAELVFGELLGNVVRHTNSEIEAAIDLSGAAPVLHVLDRGPGFSFSARLPKDSLSESGRGLYITMILARDFSVVPRRDGGSHARAVLITQPLRRDRLPALAALN